MGITVCKIHRGCNYQLFWSDREFLPLLLSHFYLLFLVACLGLAFTFVVTVDISKQGTVMTFYGLVSYRSRKTHF